ncbi:MAG: transcriptional regulator [Aliidiomarina sp.]|uniref:helix-turn-helix domain-containing transcriptional regulator n=1 Tax=Aliidiomarina sp. TaxID=1872439 RepID=UPI0025B8CE87|nr:transcriptional regulator [Aliidiomarina sp.]MCH8500762.1 transcriptional regulator [Aliidiomarina sp.]
MLKIVDVEYLGKCNFEFVFNDGLKGMADLEELFEQPSFANGAYIEKFSLTAEGNLRWGRSELTATDAKRYSIQLTPTTCLEPADVESILKQAAWDSLKLGRADILQAALRAYVEKFGHKNVIARAGIKSRTSAYRSLKPNTTPNFSTMVQIGHAVIELAQERDHEKANKNPAE